MAHTNRFPAPKEDNLVRETKAYLGQYRRLLREIAHDRRRLADIEGHLQNGIPCNDLPPVDDTTSGEAVRAALTALSARIALNLQRCVAQVTEIQAFIHRISDSEVREIFTLYYIEGYSWKRVALAMGGWDESVPRKRHNRFLAPSKKRKKV